MTLVVTTIEPPPPTTMTLVHLPWLPGANRGIGLSIVERLLAKSFRVILCCRSLEKGRDALAQLALTYGNNGIFLVQLDLDDPRSIELAQATVTQILETHKNNGRHFLDVLINNAAYVTYQFSREELEQSMKTNYWGTVAVTKAFLPLVSPRGGRIIFVSSAVGKTYLVSPWLQNRLLSDDLTEKELEAHMLDIQHQVEQGTYKLPTNGIGAVAYGLSKLAGTTIFPRILARDLLPKMEDTTTQEEYHYYVTSCCPAFGGADTPVWLATTPSLDIIRKGYGGFWEQREITNPSDWQSAMQCTFSRTGQYPIGHEG